MTIEVENVSKAFGAETVLEDVSLMLDSDSMVACTGPAGCGKTTLLRIILGLETPDRGKVNLLGDYKYDRVNAGVVFQEDRLCEDFSAVVNVAMVSSRLSERVAAEELSKLLPEDALARPVRELSPVQRRRTALVRACIIPTDVLLLDEPFAGMNEEEMAQSVRYLRETARHKPVLIAARSYDGLEFCRQMELAR